MKEQGKPTAQDRVLTTLKKKVHPSHTALLVVDMQNDFCARGGLMDKKGLDLRMTQAMAPGLVNFIDQARKAQVTVIFIQAITDTPENWYVSDVSLEQRTRTAKRSGGVDYPVCERNSWGADLYDGIKPLPGELVITKHRYSAFIDTELDVVLRSKGIRTVIMSGVGTNICVESTARDGFMKDYYIVFLKDCTAAGTEEEHNSTLRNIDLFFGEVANSGDVLKCWGHE